MKPLRSKRRARRWKLKADFRFQFLNGSFVHTADFHCLNRTTSFVWRSFRYRTACLYPSDWVLIPLLTGWNRTPSCPRWRRRRRLFCQRQTCGLKGRAAPANLTISWVVRTDGSKSSCYVISMVFECPVLGSRIKVDHGAFYLQNRGRCLTVTIFGSLLRILD